MANREDGRRSEAGVGMGRVILLTWHQASLADSLENGAVRALVCRPQLNFISVLQPRLQV